MNAMWKVVCECGWSSGYQPSAQKAKALLKKHTDNDPHRDYVDVPMF